MRFIGICFVSALALGCGSASIDTTSSTSDELATQSTTDSQWATSCRNTAAKAGVDAVAISGGVRGYPVETAIQGVTVCAGPVAGGSPTCTTTGADGIYHLDVAPCTDTRITYAASSYLAANQLLRIGTENPHIGTHMMSTAQASGLATAVGVTLDMKKALPVIATYSSSGRPLAGVTLSLDQPNGTTWYVGTSGPSGTMTATGSAGLGGWANVSPGTYVVHASITGKTCTTGAAVPGASANTGIMEAFAGSVGETVFYCD